MDEYAGIIHYALFISILRTSDWGIVFLVMLMVNIPLLKVAFTPDRVAGMYVMRPGIPAGIARPQAGPGTLEWMDAGGKPASQKVVVVKPLTRVTLP